MVDSLRSEQRSAVMSRIRRADTKPELTVRSLLHAMGYRFRVQMKGVPGRPDIAFPRRRKIVQVHGCFWHAHEGCSTFRMPKSRTDFWEAKFARNKKRDVRLEKAARAAGWDVLTLWECELHDEPLLIDKLVDFLGPLRADL
ncbi:very short patch repair endonuclease [Pseudaminobacter salicylatoxidans]|uniref:very short patch repair endonuclease n=1 Tax=Pseudaminobacter salicylatoxidans TaxID=93369 RepID=UPI0009FCAA55|nr:very short patch repair endonuclease [Pseudaminobacter salicylatoxidans]